MPQGVGAYESMGAYSRKYENIKTLISNLCNLLLKGSLGCSRNVRGILFQILTPLLEKDDKS